MFREESERSERASKGQVDEVIAMDTSGDSKRSRREEESRESDRRREEARRSVPARAFDRLLVVLCPAPVSVTSALRLRQAR